VSGSHIGSELPLKNYMIPIDYVNTEFLAHYDITKEDINGRRPYGAYVDDSCVGYWDFKKSVDSTILYDKSGKGKHGKLNGAVWTNGRNGRALYFDGTNDYVSCSGCQSDEFTITAWIYLDEIGRFHGILGRSGNIWSNTAFAFRVTSANYLNIITSSTGNGTTELGSDITLSAGIWYFVAVTCVGLDRKLYIDGVLHGQDTWGGSLYSSTSDFIIGGYSYGAGLGYLMKGKMDKLAMYSRGLSADEIYKQFNEDISTLRPIDGKFGGCIAVEDATINLISNFSVHAQGGTWTDIGEFYRGNKVYRNTVTSPGVYNNYGFTCSDIMTLNQSGDKYVQISFDCRVRVPSDVDMSGYVRVLYTDLSTQDHYWVYNISNWASGGAKINEWVRVVGKATLNSGKTPDKIQMFYVYKDKASYGEMDLTGFQIEQKSYETSFVDGSRVVGKLRYDNPVMGCSEFTVSFWTDVTNSRGNYSTILSMSDGNADPNLVCCDYSVTDGNKFRFFIYSSSGSAKVAISPVISRVGWRFVTLVKTLTSLNLYIDGTLSGTVDVTGVVHVPQMYLDIATRPAYAGARDGNVLMDELRIDKVARTPEEIEAWYVCNAPFYPKGIHRVAL
jgi:hypothetical protein